MNLFVIALALIASSCVAFVPPVVSVHLSSTSINSHLDFRKAAKEATVEMNMVKAAKEATVEVRDEVVRQGPPRECVVSAQLCFVAVGTG